MSSAQRAINDERYQQMVDLMDALPPEAKEPRLAVYPAKWKSEAKESFQPLEKILFSAYKEKGFTDKAALASYLSEKYGDGKYIIEALDPHNQRIIKIPPWVITAGDEDMDDEFEEDRPRRSSGRRFSRERFDDDFDDDDNPKDSRANIADMMSIIGKTNNLAATQAKTEAQSLTTMMMMTQQRTEENRLAEERRREDARTEERRREEARSEERRREEREEQRRHEEKVEREREERRRDAEKQDAIRREEMMKQMEIQNRRTEMLIGTITALAPVVLKVFEKKEDTTLPLLLKMTEKKDDPMMIMLLKSIMDKSASDDAGKAMVQNMGEMMKVSAQMSAEQMKSLMAMSTDINQTVMKKAMEMMMTSPQGQTEEGKSMIEQIMGALAGAAEIVKTLTPAAAPMQAIPQIAAPQQQQQQAPAAKHQPRMTPAAPAAVANEQKSEAEQKWDAMTPEERAAIQAQAPTGVMGSLVALQAIQQQRHTNQNELQGLIQYAVQTMPLDMRVAILDGNEMGVLQIAMPVIEENPTLKQWIQSDGVIAWIRGFVPQLAPSIESIHGPADAQRNQLITGVAPEAPAAAPAPPPVPAAEEPAPPAAPEAAAPSIELAVMPPPAPSHLDNEEP